MCSSSVVSSGTETRAAGTSRKQRRAAGVVLAIALFYWAFTILWFWRYCARNINIDAICYIGIARHIVDGNLRTSLHGYWSPLISWLIAAGAMLGRNFTRNARLMMIPSFAACMWLMYRFTYKLWGSTLLAALAVLWFTTARGVAAFSVDFIGADLILTALVLLYFHQLLRCLEEPSSGKNWFWLGAVHGTAFLTKAIAFPLLTLSTLIALAATHKNNWRRGMRSLGVSAMMPIIIWAGWGIALKQKYGHFTSGYQLRWNLLDPELRAAEAKRSGLVILHDDRQDFDNYTVAESMPPGSGYWNIKVWRSGLVRQVIAKELQNVPQACKELLVLLTPGGVLGLVLGVVQLMRKRQMLASRFQIACIAVLITAALIAAYCMLVFDGRYVLPMAAVLMCISARFSVPEKWISGTSAPETAGAGFWVWQSVAGGLLVAGLIGVQIYRSSPFRSLRQDYQLSTYSAAEVLDAAHVKKVVIVGTGPYPEHGVGWEAGVYSSYFAGTRILGNRVEIPRAEQMPEFQQDLQHLHPDAVMVWGVATDPLFSTAAEALRTWYPQNITSTIVDPKHGPVGAVVILNAP